MFSNDVDKNVKNVRNVRNRLENYVALSSSYLDDQISWVNKRKTLKSYKSMKSDNLDNYRVNNNKNDLISWVNRYKNCKLCKFNKQDTTSA